MKLLDYSSWLKRFRSSPRNIEYLFRGPLIDKEGWCPYCRRQADLAMLEQVSNKYLGAPEDPEWLPLSDDSSLYTLELWLCSKCGWWEYNINHIEGISDGDINDINCRAILQTYAIADNKIPVETLRNELLAKRDIIYHINDKKMEELVGSVIRDFYPGSDVRLCGKTGDGGIDLIVILGDAPMAVQVKRRMSPNSIERVETVRAFLGASLLRGYDHLLYVTTADHFTGGPFGARKEAARATKHNLVKEFHLIDRHRFFEMLHLVKDRHVDNWTKALPSMFTYLKDIKKRKYLT